MSQAGFLVALICLVGIGIVSYLSVNRVRDDADWTRHTEEVISALRLLLSDVTDVVSLQRVYTVTGEVEYLERYREERRGIPVDIQSLRTLTADNDGQQRRLDEVMSLVAIRLARSDEVIELRRQQGFAAAQAAVMTGVGKQLHEQIRALIAEMEAVEQGLLLQRGAKAKRSIARTKLIIIGGSLLAMGVVAVALFAVGRDFARRRARATQTELAGRLARLGSWTVELPALTMKWSDEICAIYEVPPGSSPSVEEGLNYYAPESRETIKRLFGACVRDGIPFDDELQLITAKGRHIWVRAIGEAQRNAKGVVQRIQGAFQDITESKRVDENIRHLAAIVDNSADAIISKCVKGLITSWNPAAEAMFSYTAAEIIGQPFQKLVPPELSGEEAEILAGLTRGEIVRQLETIRVRKNGQRFSVSTTTSLLKDSGGIIFGVSKIIRDVTERKLGLEAQQRQLAELRVLFDLMPAMIWFKDVENRILRVNQRVADAAGIPVAVIEGKTSQEIYPLDAARFHADDLEVIHSGVPKLGFVETLRGPEGKELWVQTDKVPVRDKVGKVVGIVVMAQDITKRRQDLEALRESETRFRELAENIEEVFWIADPLKHQKLYLSPAYEKIWGRTCQSAYASPEAWLDTIRPEDRDRVVQALRIKQTHGSYDEEYRITRPDGTERWIRDQAFPIRDSTGAIIRWVGLAEDITEHRKLEAQFQQAQKMEAIGTLAGGIAHDFNNILAAILGYAELAKLRVTDNPTVTDYLNALLQGANRAASLVRQMMAFSRQQKPQRVLIRLEDAVAEPLELLRATIPSSVVFDVALARDLPTVLADTTQVHQVVMNLCTNAWHAMKDRPGRLEVRLEKFDVDDHLARGNPNLRPGPYVRLSVSDNGTGMDAATLARIFEPFFTTKAPGEGTGLGLSAVHGIMKNHDGAVTVYSQPGKGTSFHLYFPAQTAGGGKVDSPALTVPRGQGESVLFVDDEKPLALLGRAMLEELGYAVTTSSNSTEALNLVRSEPAKFALVITDLTMPVMTGTDLAVQLLQIRPDLPVILTTGYTASLTAERIKALGIRELLLKPHSLLSLGIAVQRALHPTSS